MIVKIIPALLYITLVLINPCFALSLYSSIWWIITLFYGSLISLPRSLVYNPTPVTLSRSFMASTTTNISMPVLLKIMPPCQAAHPLLSHTWTNMHPENSIASHP